jgi:hypothetical protein
MAIPIEIQDSERERIRETEHINQRASISESRYMPVLVNSMSSGR